MVRTGDCSEWLKGLDGADIFVDLTQALPAQLLTAAAPPPPPHQVEDNESSSAGRDTMALRLQWRGGDVALNKSKGSGGRRNNQHDSGDLPPAAAAIVQGDKGAASWRQKLQAMENILCFGDPGSADVDALGYSSIYLFWVGVGAIACVEDGSHYRPNHHAGSSQRIYESLEAVEREGTGVGGRRAEEVRALVRRLHPRLPAFTAEFTQSVPLTRIRDIAHGKGDHNGKCRDVRQEIKHTIQNKLHRCAGPEDLVATENMLAKLTAPGTDYPQEFVEEFRIFHRELKDFFNASTVTDRLDKLLADGSAPGHVAHACRGFMSAKSTVDGIDGGSGGGRGGGGGEADAALLAALEEALGALCEARRTIDEALGSGALCSAAADQRQQWRLAEIGLEDYAFVLLSRGINALGAESDPPRAELSGREMRAALRFLGAAAGGTALSAGGGGAEEFSAIAREAAVLATAGADGLPPAGGEGALRVRAVAERARRASEDYCSLLSELFDGRAAALGHALGIDSGTVDVFTEGQIRASVVFQSAKLASHLLRAARAATGEAGWDCLVPGEVVGAELRSVDRLDPSDPAIAAATAANPVVLVVGRADGDEEVSTLGPGVAGILLCHALPHLSHLALRARQAKVPLVAIEDPALIDFARGFQGAPIRLLAQASNVTLEAAPMGGGGGGGGGGGSGGAAAAAGAAPAAAPGAAPALTADMSRASQVVPLAELGALPWAVAVALAGSKAAACARLSAVAEDPAADFAAPPGAVLPFGSMEAAAAAAGLDDRLASLVDELEASSSGAGKSTSETARVCSELTALVRTLRPPPRTLAALAEHFEEGQKVMVRSSGNAEDLAGLSAAGLYDSIANVDAGRGLHSSIFQLNLSRF